MSKLADKVVEKLFTDWKGKPVPRLIQDGTNGAGWGKEVVRAIIEEAEQGVEPTAPRIKAGNNFSYMLSQQIKKD